MTAADNCKPAAFDDGEWTIVEPNDGAGDAVNNTDTTGDDAEDGGNDERDQSVDGAVDQEQGQETTNQDDQDQQD
jgi:hypothetical protein